MKKYFLLLLLTAQCGAALPPLWQNVAELKAILEDKRLGEKLESGEVIMEIENTDASWLITTNHNQLSVNVVYGKRDMPGPATFTLEFGNPEKL